MLTVMVLIFGFTLFIIRLLYRSWKKYGGLNGWFFRPKPNLIYTITAGDVGPIVSYIGEFPDVVVDSKTGKISTRGSGTNETLSRVIFDIFKYHPIGIPFEPWKRTVSNGLRIDKVKLKSTAKILGEEGKYLSDNVQAEEDVPTEGLRREFQRIQIIPEIDIIGDNENFRVELQTTAFCRVVDAAPIFEKYPKDFLQLISSTINSYFNARLKGANLDKFKSEIGGEVDTQGLVIINESLRKVGVEIDKILIDDWGYAKSSKEVQDELQKVSLARASATRKKIDVDAEAEVIKKLADARLHEAQQLAIGKAALLAATIKEYTVGGVSAEFAVTKANEEIKNREKYEKLTKLTTLIEGGNTGTILPIGGKDD
ncbi:MAG: SPFH domain-containing protein [Minisyncoccota bacterium]